MARFKHRTDAGQELATVLSPYRRELAGGIVLGIPRGGMVAAAEVARAFQLPLRPLIVAKVGAPGNPEYAVGAVGPDGRAVLDDATGYEPIELQPSIDRARAKIRELQRELGVLDQTELEDRPVIVIDDGLATGRTMNLAVQWLRQQHPRSITVAVPVAPPDTVTALEPLVNRLVVLHQPGWFGGVGAFYADFPQISTQEARTILSRANAGTNRYPRVNPWYWGASRALQQQGLLT